MKLFTYLLTYLLNYEGSTMPVPHRNSNPNSKEVTTLMYNGKGGK